MFAGAFSEVVVIGSVNKRRWRRSVFSAEAVGSSLPRSVVSRLRAVKGCFHCDVCDACRGRLAVSVKRRALGCE